VILTVNNDKSQTELRLSAVTTEQLYNHNGTVEIPAIEKRLAGRDRLASIVLKTTDCKGTIKMMP
jgi:hypothetical protein